jgi:serine protease Do
MNVGFRHRGRVVAIGVLIGLGLWAAAAAAQSRNSGVIRMFPELAESGAYLGIQMEDVTPANLSAHKLSAERGVIVRAVEKGSPAESAKLQENDVILEYCGMPVISAAQFGRMVRETPSGRIVDLSVSRDGKKLTISAKLGNQPPPAEDNLGNIQRYFNLPAPGGRNFQYRVQPRTMVPPLDRPPDKPRLGVSLQPLTDQMAEFLGVTGKTGAMITAVETGSPAAGKLKAGDVVISADGKRVADPDDLSQIVQQKSGKLELKVIRERKEVTVSVDLPPNAGPVKL